MSESRKQMADFNDKISIGIPTFNRPDSLKRTLDYLINQSYQNVEIIISDNCSTDKSVKEIIEEYSSKDKRIIPYIQKKNIGMVKNFEFVLDKASSNFFMWKSDDDKIEDNDFIKKLYSKLTITDSDFAFPESFYLNKDGSKTSVLYNIYSKCSTKFDYIRAISYTFSCLEFYGLYNLGKFKKGELKFNENIVCPDTLYIPHLFLNHKVVFEPNTYYIFVHEPSPEGFKANMNLFKDRQIVMRDLITNFAATELLTSSERKEVVANILQYYENIIDEKYSVSIITQTKTKVKNKLKILFRLGKT